jgi:hypothetical protein
MVEKPELLAHLRASPGADVGGVSPLHGAYPAAARARGLCDVPSATKTAKHEPTHTTASASAFASARACVQSTTKGGAGFCLPRGALRDGHRLIHPENLPRSTCFGRQSHTTARATLRCVRTLRESARKHGWNGCGGRTDHQARLAIYAWLLRQYVHRAKELEELRVHDGTLQYTSLPVSYSTSALVWEIRADVGGESPMQSRCGCGRVRCGCVQPCRRSGPRRS